MNLSILDDVQLDSKARASVNYAKARIYIDANAQCRSEKRKLKNLVIEHFGGQVREGEVSFPDNSKARF